MIKFARKYLISRLALLVFAMLPAATAFAAPSELRVCAEPDNLPFSNHRREGFENKIAALLASDLKAKLSFTWEKQRQGYIRNTLGTKRCDVIMGVPRSSERVLTVGPYYRSGYVLLTKNTSHLDIRSLDDPRLHELRIGLHAIGNDGSNSPPAHALVRRNIVRNVVGYSMWGDASVSNPQGQLIDAVAKGEIDVAIVWGPLAGYFAKPYGGELVVTPLPADPEMPSQPFAFDIALGVRKDESAFAAQLEKSLARNQRAIEAILTAYHVPLLNSDHGQVAAPSYAGDQALQKHSAR